MIMAAINLFIYIVVCLILYMLYEWLVTQVPIADPMARIIRIVLVVLFTLIVVLLLLNMVGVQVGPSLPRL